MDKAVQGFSVKRHGAPNQNLRGYNMRILSPCFLNQFANSLHDLAASLPFLSFCFNL